MDLQRNNLSITVTNDLRRAERELLEQPTSDRLAALFRALSDPTRVRIISALSHSELSVGHLAGLLEMTQSAVSHQLRTLREMRLVRNRRVGKHVYYTLDDEHIHDLYHRGLEHIGHG